MDLSSQAPDWRGVQQCAPTLQALDIHADAPLADIVGKGLVWARLRSMKIAVPVHVPGDSQVWNPEPENSQVWNAELKDGQVWNPEPEIACGTPNGRTSKSET